MSTQMGPSAMGGSHGEFYDLEEVEALAKRKLKKPVSACIHLHSVGPNSCHLLAVTCTHGHLTERRLLNSGVRLLRWRS